MLFFKLVRTGDLNVNKFTLKLSYYISKCYRHDWKFDFDTNTL